MKIPTVAIVGRPNVGKSTLFNRLTSSRNALVDDMPGVTRDRIYGKCDWIGKYFSVIDTGGFDPSVVEGIWKEMKNQVMLAIEEADIIVFLLDGQEGVTPTDREVASYLRKKARAPVFFTINKIDLKEHEQNVDAFWDLAPDKLYPISSEHGRGVDDLLDDIVAKLPECKEVEDESAIAVAVVGKPNVGKSTLINKLLGSERFLTHDAPGTTRDAVDTLIERNGKKYRFVDTAGIRRKARVSDKIEIFSVLKALKAIEMCHVMVLIMDATLGVSDQDAKVAGYAVERGKAIVIALNKWDIMEKTHKTFDETTKTIKENLRHVDFAEVISISAKTGMRVERIFETIDKADEQHSRRITTSDLNKMLETATKKHQPSVSSGKRIRFYYGTQFAVRPPRFAFFTNRPNDIGQSYENYLVNQLREVFGFEGTPIRLVFRARKGHKGGD